MSRVTNIYPVPICTILQVKVEQGLKCASVQYMRMYKDG